MVIEFAQERGEPGARGNAHQVEEAVTCGAPVRHPKLAEDMRVIFVKHSKAHTGEREHPQEHRLELAEAFGCGDLRQ